MESLRPTGRNLSSTFYIGSVGEYCVNNNVWFVTQEHDFDLGNAFAGVGGGQPFRYLWSVTDGFQLIKIELKCRLVF